MKTRDLRLAFLRYFEERGHLIRPSAPLVLDDPTTFFTSAGVQPYVPAFRGEEPPPAPRVASCQKCARMGDLEGVGRKARYHTFFEMLGNFSFGDYFKEGAIEYAWEFLTQTLGLPAEPLWVTVFETDDEAEEIWHTKIGVPRDRILRFGRSDNWWPKVRWEGPCGPCTEIHYDLGPEVGCGKPECAVGCDCDRFLEVWNLVFQQFVEAEDGSLTPLPKPGVDTGMSLERLAMVLQGKRWTADTDELRAIMDRAAETLSEVGGAPPVQYDEGADTDIALRIITDHVRAVAFLMADGATPSNEGPGYILRRLIRRAHRLGRSRGATSPFLYTALPRVTEVYGETYPELLPKREFSAKVVHSEEERFGRALGRGLQEFDELRESLQARGETVIPGQEAFRLLATYGLPPDFTEEMAEDAGMTVDRESFEAAKADHEKRSGREKKGLELHDGKTDLPPTEFVGYEGTVAHAAVLVIQRDGEAVENAEEGAEIEIVLDRTPFYAERGGQVGDTGELETAAGAALTVRNVVPGPGDSILHECIVVAGAVGVGDAVTATVDEPRRRDVMRHHTATHLLQAALRKTLGTHVTQQGSLVAPDRLRFDFTHHEAMSPEEIAEVEDLVNEWILADLPVAVEVKSREEAVAEGAIALFGEKYEDTVRVVKIGAESMELCGGTHASSTGFIGSLRIVSEASAAANVRRIEAVTGLPAVHRAREREALLAQAAQALGCRPEELPDRIAALRAQLAEAKKAAVDAEVRAAKVIIAPTGAPSQAAVGTPTLIQGPPPEQPVGPAKLLIQRSDNLREEALKSLADEMVARGTKVVALIASAGTDGKVRLVCKVDSSLVAQGAHAGKLVGEVAKLGGGGGGGKATFAEAGGVDAEAAKLYGALNAAAGILARQLEE